MFFYSIMWLLSLFVVVIVALVHVCLCKSLSVTKISKWSMVFRADVFRRHKLSIQTDGGAKASQCQNESDYVCQAHTSYSKLS